MRPTPAQRRVLEILRDKGRGAVEDIHWRVLRAVRGSGWVRWRMSHVDNFMKYEITEAGRKALEGK